jgi:hypothetical protein
MLTGLMIHARSTLLAFALLAACATSPKPGAPVPPAPAGPAALPPLALMPAAEARASLTMVVTAAAPESLAASLDAFADRLQLPMKLGQAALDQLTRQTTGPLLTREQLGRLDPGQSVAVVALPTGPCLALTFKDAGLARKTLEETGPETQRVEGASARKMSSGQEAWMGLSDRTLLAATTKDALLAAGALALEAQRMPRDGLVAVTLYPQNMAQAQGMSLAALVDLAVASMAADLQKKAPAGKAKPAPKGKKPAAKQEITPAMAQMMVAFFRAMAQPIVEAQTVQVSLKLNPTDGFLLRTEIAPLPGSPSAGRTQTQPYALDPKLAVADDRTMVMASGPAGHGMLAMLNALASTGPKGKGMIKQFNTVLTEIVGGGACTMPAATPMTMMCAFQLRAGVTPERALTAYTGMIKEAQGWQDELIGKKSKIKVKRSKDLLEVEMTMPQADPATRAMQQAMWGGDTQRYVVTVRDGRVVQAVGSKPRELLESWSKAAPAGNAPIFAGATARTRGAEILFFADPVAFFGAMVKGAQDPSVKQAGAMMNAVPGLATLQAPVVFAVWGGKTTAFELQLPFQSLANVAQVVRPFMGMMGGPPPPPPPK